MISLIKMQLNFLLLFGILVTWSCTKETDQIPSSFLEKSTCLNDGHFNGSGCDCKNYFYGNNCENTRCLNEGKNSNTNCKCLPGFLGVHCEPVKCISGDSQSFNTSDKPSVSVFITYNSNFKNKATDDDPIEHLCNKKNDIDTTWYLNGFKVRNICDKKIDISSQCDDVPLDISLIELMITNMESNGEAIILSNYALPKNTTQNSINRVLKIAIARRIRINVIAYAPMYLIDNQEYNDDPGYSALRNLTDSTLGFFITPYNGFINKLNGNTTVSKVIDVIIARHKYGTVALKSAKSRGSVMYNVGNQTYYLALRTLTTADRDAKAHIFMKPNNLTTVADTGYWRLYSGQEPTGKITVIMNPNIKKDFNIMLLSETYLETHVAVSTDDSVDASSPYVLSGSSESILVARIKMDKTLLSNEMLKRVELPKSISFEPNIQNRNHCQFSLALGNISCSGEKAFTITFTAQNFMASTIPFMCVADPSDTTEVFMDEVSPYIYKSSPKCTNAASLIKNPKRSFIISFRNSKSNDTRLSIVDNLFVLPGNIFELLVPLQKKSIYTYYVANFYTKKFTDMRQLNNTLEGFMTNVMNNIHNATEVNICEEDRDLYKRLLQILQTVKEPYSDVFFIVNSKYTGDLNSTEVLKHIYNSRTKLYFILMETHCKYSYINYQHFADLAMRSGGAAFRISDFTVLSSFFKQYFNGIVGGDVVTHSIVDFMQSDIRTDEVFMNSNSNYTMLITSGYSIANISSSNNNTAVVNVNQTVFGELRVITFSVSVSDKVQLNLRLRRLIRAPQISNIILLEHTSNANDINIAITSNKKECDVTSGAIYFASELSVEQSKQFIVIQDKINTTHNVSIRSSKYYKRPLIKNATLRDNHKFTFNYLVDYNWICDEPNGTYFIKVDSLENKQTRTQIFTCIALDRNPCLNGQLDEEKKCRCQVGWNGTLCETRICLNGGTQIGNQCNCTTGYDGDFCQNSKSSCTTTSKPVFKSEITSLLLVIERSIENLHDIETCNNLDGRQIVVVQYGAGETTLSLSTTLGNKINSGLKYQYDDKTSNDIVGAIRLALNSQLTDRALLILLTSGTDFEMDQELVNRLSAQRVELRVFTENVPGVNLTLLSTLGNGIPFLHKRYFFTDYFSEYICNLFPKKSRNKEIPHLNVVQSDKSCDTTVTLPAYEQNSTVFVHLYNANLAIKSPEGLKPDPVGNSSSQIFIFSTTAKKSTNINITRNTDSNGDCSYSIEVLHFLKTAYGFQSGTSDKFIFAGLTKNANFMSIFNGKSEANSFSLAEAQIRAINLNGTLKEPELLPISVEGGSCSYSYYTQVPECSADIYGYQTQIRIPSTLKQQQQISVICQKPMKESCGHGYESGGVCQCDAGWTGMDCRQPICHNSGTADGEVCNCQWHYSGILCESPRRPIGQVSGLAFIVDTIGSYPSVYNSSITAIKEFVLGSHSKVSVIVVVDNANQKLATYHTVKQFESRIGDFEPLRDPDSKVNLDGAFTRILEKFERLKCKGNNLIFYVTQIGGILENRTNINILKRQYNSPIVAIGMSDYKVPILDIVMEQLRVLTENVSNADNWYTAVMEMFRLSGESNYSTPTPPRLPSCIYDVQASIFVAVELSTVDKADEYKKKTLKFLDLFRSDMNIGLDKDPGCDPCKFNTSIFKGYSKLSGWTYFGDSFSGGTPQFCTSNYEMIIGSIKTDSTSEKLDLTDDLEYWKYYLEDTCRCSRVNDSETTKVIIWIPRTPYKSDNYTDLTNNSYNHYVIHFGFTPDKDDLYYKLADSKNRLLIDETLIDGDKFTSEKLAQEMWTRICRLSGQISINSTAEPPKFVPDMFDQYYETIFD